MKKQNLLITLALASSLSWVGCHKSRPQSDWSKPPTQAVPAGPTELKLKWPLNGRLVFNLDVDSQSELTVPNVPNPINQDTTSVQKYAFTVLKERVGAGREVEMEFLGIRMKSTTGGRVDLDFDSTRQPAQDGKNPMVPALRKLVGTKVRFLLDASNQVEGVQGISDFQTRLASEAKKDPSGTIKSMFSEVYWRQFMDGTRILQAKPVGPGDTWSMQRDIVMGALGLAVLDQTYTFKGWETHDQRNCARLEFEGTVTLKPDQPPPRPGMVVSIEDGKTSGVTWFDPERGVFVETTIDLTTKLNITVPNQGQSMTITGPVTVKVISRLESAE